MMEYALYEYRRPAPIEAFGVDGGYVAAVNIPFWLHMLASLCPSRQ